MTAEARIGVVHRPGVSYPSPVDCFSPSEEFPEYRYGPPAAAPNPIYAMVRELLADAGLDTERFGQPDWNPLGGYIAVGSPVFVLCNFVYHRRGVETEEDFRAKCVHGSVLRAVIDYALIATGPGGEVRFGNAPLQSCNWTKVLRDTESDAVLGFYEQHGLPVTAVDLRSVVSEWTALGRMISRVEPSGSVPGIEIDLGASSLLDEHYRTAGAEPHYRVADYDPTRTELQHSRGRHVYDVSPALLAASTVISLSKLKTHEKVGVTCGLKGFVGSVGSKDCLAHHRTGSPSSGGDEYSNRLRPLRPLSAAEDWLARSESANRVTGGLQVAHRSLRRVLRRLGLCIGGAWPGNDTAWRMALDLVRIAQYADSSGVLREEPQRRLISFVDGVVAGEGQGPLIPRPVRTGALLFSDDVATGDRAACRLMGIDLRAVPLVREAFRPGPYSLAEPVAVTTVVNGENVAEDRIPLAAGRPFESPRGWRRPFRAP